MNTKPTITAEFQRVIDAVNKKVPFIFINGPAGTGKSTLTRYLKDKLANEGRNAVFVAPTGIAALNVGGATIHSYFRFPFGVILNDSIKKPAKDDIYKAMDVLFIDEGSMARCDMIDGIDTFLRRARGSRSPFGGVQVVIVGDLYQLPPVVTKEDVPVLERAGYTQKSYYFFDAKVFSKLPHLSIELTHVFRQPSREFAAKLSKVRIGQAIDATVDALNQVCHGRRAHPQSITLTTTNAIADSRNSAALAKLPGKSKKYAGKVGGKFKESIGRTLPSPEALVLKVGAQVMFTCNEKEGLWSNGTLGVVTQLNDKSVQVKLPDGFVVSVVANTWESHEYYTDTDKKLKQRSTGYFTQIPLMLAWAITIHKSQGQTLDYLHIDMGYGSFATGQTYVALSRARTIEGMTFAKPIKPSDIKCCPRVLQYLGHGKAQPGQLF